MTNLLIIAGEVSGDLHGANLLIEIKRLKPDTVFFGIGGDNMINSGLNAIFHIRQLSFLGFTEVLKHLPFIRKVKISLLNIVKAQNIKTAILIDYPGFNLNIAKKLHDMNVRIVYYISPQIWAWGKNRVKKIQSFVSRMLVVFPFEKEFYKNFGVNAEFVGHPVIERLNNYELMSKSDFYKKNKLSVDKEILLLMPGSRKHEVQMILPQLINAAKTIAVKYNLQIVVACSAGIDDSFLSSFSDDKVKIVYNQTYELMKYSRFGMIKSGTSTLEAALFDLPFIVVYKISRSSYLIGKFLIKLKSIAIPNIILGKQVVPELIQNDLTEVNIVKICDELLKDESNLLSMKMELSKIRNLLGNKKASIESAKIIVSLMNEN